MSFTISAGRPAVPKRAPASVSGNAPVGQTQTIGVPTNVNLEIPTPLLTTEQAAEFLQVSVRTVKNLLSDGRIAYIKIGRATRIHRQDLDVYIAQNRRKQRSRLRA